MRNAITILTWLIFLSFVGLCIYFVGGVSATIPPIKKYIFQGNVEQFGKSLEKYASFNPNLKFKISRRDSSNKVDDGGRDIDIEAQKSDVHITYALVCENVEKDNTINTEIDLVEARDTTHNIGGYGIKADGMKSLLDYFENDFFAGLKKNQHVIINPKKESFFDKIHIY